MRLNPEKAEGLRLTLNIVVDGTPVALTLDRQAEFARIGATFDSPDASLHIEQLALENLASGDITLSQALDQGARLTGRAGAVAQWLELHDSFDLWFDVVSP